MKSLVYVENELLSHPRIEKLKKQLHTDRIIPIDRYQQLFNRGQQDFRAQKNHPSWILAKRHGTLLHQVPDGYGIGRKHNYYFSHFLNCPFDCRYCFLQGMFRSANYVHFINYEDFFSAMETMMRVLGEEHVTFFSGYDGDSLALEHITHFAEEFVAFFRQFPRGELELRTKSINIRHLLSIEPVESVVIAYSLNPDIVTEKIEKKTPPLKKRIVALQKLQSCGWKIGLRFDPLIWFQGCESLYSELFDLVAKELSLDSVHSVTLGAMRAPKHVMRQMQKLLASDPLIASCQSEHSLIEFSQKYLETLLPKNKVFVCQDAS